MMIQRIGKRIWPFRKYFVKRTNKSTSGIFYFSIKFRIRMMEQNKASPSLQEFMNQVPEIPEEERQNIISLLQKEGLETVESMKGITSVELKQIGIKLFWAKQICNTLNPIEEKEDSNARIKTVIKDDKLYLGGCKAEDLVQKFGSPLFVYEEEYIRSRIRYVLECIKYDSIKIHYACKANTNAQIMKVLREEGCHIDAVSTEEIYLCLKSGFQPNEIIFTGNNSRSDEFQFCIDNNILVNLGSLSQIDRYGKMNPNVNICVRINPNVSAGHHEQSMTGGPHSKFGIFLNQVPEILEAAKKHNLKIIGVHCHIGSGITDKAKLIEGVKALLFVAKSFPELEFVDCGGGFGVPEKPSDPALDMKKMGEEISKIFTDFSKEYGRHLTYYFELGRYLVAESGTLLATVTNINPTPLHTFVGVDSSINHLIAPCLFGTYHEIINATNSGDIQMPYKIVGNLCNSGDIFTPLDDRPISFIHEGDVLAFRTAGAYAFSKANHYNSRLLPAEIFVKNGESRLIREPEKKEDLLKGQFF